LSIDVLLDPGTLPIRPIRRIAPSRLGALRACARREVFRASGAPQLLSWPGAAYLGSVIHAVLEDAAGRAFLSEIDAEAIFSAKLDEEEARLRQSATGRRILPLARSVGDFEVRKRRTIKAAIARSGRPKSGRARSDRAVYVGTERWLESKDGTIGGYVDEIAATQHGIVLRDFKSGSAARPGTPQYLNAREQLDIYAALYEEVTDTLPTHTEVVPIDGEAIAEDVSADRCHMALDAAKTSLREINSAVESLAPARVDSELARPAPLVCRQCDYRPVCLTYLRTSHEGENWPIDLVGALSQSLSLRNGTLLLEIAGREGSAFVRGVSRDPARHPELEMIPAGGALGLFNLAGNVTARSFATTPITAIVGYERLPIL
jgi:hypothetical protein